MNNVVQSRTRFEASVTTTTYLLPTVLAVNTAALFALEQLGGIPSWVKTAVAMFLAF